MENMVFVYGIAVVVALMVASLVGMAVVKARNESAASVPVEINR
jgi:hypothetical protein